MIKNEVVRGIVLAKNTVFTTITGELEDVLESVVVLAGLDQSTELKDLIYAAEEIMLDMVEENDMSEEDYLRLCRELTYLLLDGNIASLIA